MKGQTQPVVLMLTATVLVGSIASVYVWGEPILTKGQDQAELQNLEQDVIDLHGKVIQVANGGEGTSETVSIGEGLSPSGQFQISVDEQRNFIEVSESTENPPYPIDTWTLIEGKTLQNLSFGQGSYALKGDDLPGVVAVNPRGSAEETLLTYRSDFRNMYTETPTGERLERIDLSTAGRSSTSDPATLVISNEGTSWDRGEDRVDVEGRKIERRNTNVQIDIR